MPAQPAVSASTPAALTADVQPRRPSSRQQTRQPHRLRRRRLQMSRRLQTQVLRQRRLQSAAQCAHICWSGAICEPCLLQSRHQVPWVPLVTWRSGVVLKSWLQCSLACQSTRLPAALCSWGSGEDGSGQGASAACSCPAIVRATACAGPEGRCARPVSGLQGCSKGR